MAIFFIIDRNTMKNILLQQLPHTHLSRRIMIIYYDNSKTCNTILISLIIHSRGICAPRTLLPNLFTSAAAQLLYVSSIPFELLNFSILCPLSFTFNLYRLVCFHVIHFYLITSDDDRRPRYRSFLTYFLHNFIH